MQLKFFKNSDLSDDDLLRTYRQSKDSKMIGELYLRYHNQILSVCSCYFKLSESEDTAMEIFERLPQQIVKFEIKNFKSWLLSVTHNFCRSKANRNNRSGENNLEYIEDFTESFIENAMILSLIEESNETENGRLIDLILDALDYLDKDQRLCMELFYLQEKSYKEIEEITQWTYNQIKSHIQNARRNIKAYIDKISKNKSVEIDSQNLVKIFMEKMQFLSLMYESNKTDHEKLDKWVKDAYYMLETDQKRCIELLYLQNKTYREIERITHWNFYKIKGCLERGRNNMKEYIERKVNGHEPI